MPKTQAEFPSQSRQPSPKIHVVREGRSPFNLKAANRLARGSSLSDGLFCLKEEAAALLPPRIVGPPSIEVSPDRGRFGFLSPVDWRMTTSVCHPDVDRSWNDSARSRCVAALQRRPSSSYNPVSFRHPRIEWWLPRKGRPSDGGNIAGGSWMR